MPREGHARETLDRRPARNVLHAPATRPGDRATATPVTHVIRDPLVRIAKVQRGRRDVTAREADQIDRRVLATAHPRR
jgi:hypothetical protein